MGARQGKGREMSSVVPFVDLQQQYLLHQEAFEAAMHEVCISCSYILGDETERFEERFAEYVGVGEAVGVGSGTDALGLSCQALGIGQDDEVLVPANTFIASVLGAAELGAKVVPVDIDAESYLMDMADAEAKVTATTKAIVAVHLYGQCMDMDDVVEFAERHGLVLIEDACQSHGAMWQGRRAGSFGSVGCFSFYPAKNLGAFGDGGMVVTNNPEIAGKLRLLRNYGSVEKYRHESVGTNSRLDSLQAAVLNVKLGMLDDWNAMRFRAARRYAEGLRGLDAVKTPGCAPDDASRHVFHLFVIQCERRDELLAELSTHGIQCGIHYPVPLHLHGAFRDFGVKRGSLSVAEGHASTILSLPMFPELADEQIDRVVDAIWTFYGA